MKFTTLQLLQLQLLVFVVAVVTFSPLASSWSSSAFSVTIPPTTTTRSAWSTTQTQTTRRTTTRDTNTKERHHHGGGRVTTTQLYMGWGPDPVWSAATVQPPAGTSACPSGKSVRVTLAVPPETALQYTVPGQYVQVRLKRSSDDDTIKPAFLAICSAPNAENASFDFLIKKTDSNEWLTNAVVGTTTTTDALEISQVLGGGYAMTENLEGFKYDFPTQNVLLFAAGSGIAPIAAAIESGLLLTERSRTCRLYYGERTADDLCFVEKFSAWEDMGIEVVPVLSQPDKIWQGRSGYIQTALAEDGIAIPRNTGALLCGMKGMTEAVKELLLAAGVFEGRVLFNF